jgi:hypothetical protein
MQPAPLAERACYPRGIGKKRLNIHGINSEVTSFNHGNFEKSRVYATFAGTNYV